MVPLTGIVEERVPRILVYVYFKLKIMRAHPLLSNARIPKISWYEYCVMTPKKVFSAEKAKKIGEKLGIDWSKFDVEQFRVGMDVELEHGKENNLTNVTNDDPLMTGKIALAHLNEFPDYYTRLLKLEEEAEEYWDNK